MPKKFTPSLALFTSLFLFPLCSLLAQQNMTLLGTLPYNDCLSNIWGYVNNNIEYALVGTCNGTSIVSLANPSQPTEVAFVEDAPSIWHEVKTWDHYSYTVNEEGNGMTIIDLADLPNSIQSYTWNGAGDPLLGGETIETSHSIFIDEKGWCYLFGSAGVFGDVGGAVVLDLTVDPINPPVIGMYEDFYIHDGMARGDTLWAGHILDGFITVVNMSDPMNPQVLAQWNTPNNFSHNIWISDDAHYAFTTDEVDGAYVAAYDVSDLSDVKEVDRIQSSPGMQVVPHNTYYLNGFLPTSYYKDGVVVFDAMLPNTLVEVASYDTSPMSGSGMEGDWGVYPYLPSGRLLASDMEEGLFVLQPNYQHACYVQGIVTNQTTTLPIVNAAVTLNGTQIDLSDFSGNYSLGIADSGTYTLTVNLTGYEPFSTTVTIDNGQILPFNIELQPTIPFVFTVQANNGNGTPLPNVAIYIQNSDLSFNALTDANGLATWTSFVEGDYSIAVGAWGYVTQGGVHSINADNANLVFTLPIGYYDDFALDFNWTVTGNAVNGTWERGEPNGTTFDGLPMAPDVDVDTDVIDQCYVTGNGIGSASQFDVDNGNTRLTSPVFNLTGYQDPHLTCYYWFINDGGNGSPNDKLFIRLNNGTTEVVLFQVPSNNPFAGNWQQLDVRISDFITPTANMTVSFETSDAQASGHLVEAGVDVFTIYDNTIIGIEPTADNQVAIQLVPNPCTDDVLLQIPQIVWDNATSQVSFNLFDMTGRIVKTTIITSNQQMIDLQNLATGIYYYTVTTEQQTLHGELLKY